MSKVVAMLGGFGAILALFGAIVVAFTGGVGVVWGVNDASSYAGRGMGAAVFAVVGLTGAVVALSHIRVGASLLIASSILGLLVVWWFYLVGAILMFSAAGIAFLGRTAASK